MTLWTLLLLACGTSTPDAATPEAPETPAKEAPADSPKASPRAAPTRSHVKVGALSEDDLEMGCSCTFSFDDGGPASGFALSGDVNDDLYKLSLGGKVVSVELKETVDDTTKVYEGGGWTVRTHVTSAGECAKGDLDCEAPPSARDVTVQGEGGSLTFGVHGACGC